MPSLFIFLFTHSFVNISVLSNIPTPHCTIIYTPLSQQLLYPSIKNTPSNPLFTPSIYSFLLLGISPKPEARHTHLITPTPSCHLFPC
ncbi:hypothetical protein FKM82_027782 [Ascaphus truei]